MIKSYLGMLFILKMICQVNWEERQKAEGESVKSLLTSFRCWARKVQT